MEAMVSENAGRDELRFIIDIRPAVQLARFWETVFGVTDIIEAPADPGLNLTSQPLI
jgi:hypothetical protein